jgi:hypothetical protein
MCIVYIYIYLYGLPFSLTFSKFLIRFISPLLFVVLQGTFILTSILRHIICVLLSVSTRLSRLMLHYPNYMFCGRFAINGIEAVQLLIAYITHFLCF